MQWHATTAEDTLKEQKVDVATGLSEGEVLLRREKYGTNQLKAQKGKTLFQKFLDQFKDFMVIVLLVAALISGFALDEWFDCLIIGIVVVINAVLGVVQENKAENALAALKKMSSPHAKVRRDGQIHVITAEEVVPGDVVVLETGDYVPADIRLTQAVNLKAQESALTGESEAVEKSTEVVAADVALGDMRNIAFSGSLITYGRGEGVVVQTGMNTQIGQIAGLLNKEEQTQTPLQKRLADMSKKLAMACIGVCAVVFLIGVLYGKDPLEMFMTAISLAVAAIPEGMLAIVTIVLAIGVQKMSEQNAIIRRLPAVETLGSATVVCSDKTGTLTLNKMTVVATAAPFEKADKESHINQPNAVLLSTAMALCNDGQQGAHDGEQVFFGDPTETALLDFVKPMGFERDRMECRMPRIDEIPFDSERKRMTTVHRDGNTIRSFVKGGLDEILAVTTQIYDGQIRPITDEDRARIAQTSEEMAQAALRVLAFAMGEPCEVTETDKASAYESNLIFLGMTGMIDPARPSAKEAVARCRQAGIKPVMITGDHKITATAIAKDLGILQKEDRVITGIDLERMDDDRLREEVRNIAVYARVSPEHKLRIVKAWQSWGDVVAMTGDGVNDAPALKRADIGIAMGITGTEVSKEASAMILTDDNFATIVTAIGRGRTVYANILKAIQFLLSSNLGEILVIFIATLLNWETPLLPIHILWINLITDTFPALALGMEPSEKNIMQQQPRDPKSSIFEKPLLFRLLYQGIMVAALTLGAFVIGNGVSVDTGRTMAFAVLSLSQIVHAYNLRSNTFSLFSKMEKNKWMTYATLGSLALQAIVFFIPFIHDIFNITYLSLNQWVIVAVLSLVPILVVEIMKKLGLTGEHFKKR